jgi:hypothetical protein
VGEEITAEAEFEIWAEVVEDSLGDGEEDEVKSWGLSREKDVCIGAENFFLRCC